MLTLIVQDQPHRAVTHFRRKLVRCLAHDAPPYSGVGASGKPGAVQNDPSIGIIGATGAIGRELVGNLLHLGRLRLAVRDRLKAAELFGNVGDALGIEEINLTERKELLRFCAGCTVVVNCAGPSCRVLETVADAALSVGAHYVDPGGDDALCDTLFRRGSERSAVVLAAGMLPGLSGLLPLSLMENFECIDHIVGYAGGIDRFSPAGAEDFIASLSNGFGSGGACLRAGQVSRSPHSLSVSRELHGIPAFEARPFVSSEFVRMCRQVGAKNGDWFNIFFDRHVLEYISLVALGAVETGGANDDLVHGLMRASALDAAGRTPFQVLAVEMSGRKEDRPCTITSIIHAESGAKLSASMAASATLAVCRGNVPAGVHYAADILSPRATIEEIRQRLPELRHTVFMGAGNRVEEGIL